MEELLSFKSIVLDDKKVAKATHNILAYRFVDRKGVSHYDHDDDGESAAGLVFVIVDI